MGDLPRKNVGLIVMGDLPKEKEKSGLIVMGDLPKEKEKSGLIVMGDLPRWKNGLIIIDRDQIKILNSSLFFAILS
jgi:hypothetical protein